MYGEILQLLLVLFDILQHNFSYWILLMTVLITVVILQWCKLLSPCGGNYSIEKLTNYAFHPLHRPGRTLVLPTPVRLDRSFRWSRFFTLCYQRQTLARTTRSHHSYFIVWAQTRHWLGCRGLFAYTILKHSIPPPCLFKNVLVTSVLQRYC